MLTVAKCAREAKQGEQAHETSDPVVAALYVESGGVYTGLHDVDPWDAKRDARRYAGPYPVVAHPPCARWCRLAKQVESRGGHAVGADGGCFASALAAVREYGGVLEHPAVSLAWRAHGLLHPPPAGGWVNADWVGGWACQVEQGHYGHPSRKATWLYAVCCDLPVLRWGPSESAAVVSTSRRTRGTKPEMRKRDRARTPIAFRNMLLNMARSVYARRCA